MLFSAALPILVYMTGGDVKAAVGFLIPMQCLLSVCPAELSEHSFYMGDVELLVQVLPYVLVATK